MNRKQSSSQEAMEILKRVFADQPDLLDVISLSDIESEEHIKALTQKELFVEPIKMYVTGRTGAGKSSIGNSILRAELLESTGHMDCTSTIGILRLKSNLYFIDTPGAGSNEDYENITRAALLLQQLPTDQITEFGVLDYTDAKVEDKEPIGIVKHKVDVGKWQAFENYQKFEPDVILFVVAPQRQFIRDDRHYLTDLLKVHKHKVIVALNLFVKDGVEMSTPENIEDTISEIEKVYAQVDKTLPRRFLRINAVSGSGINKVTQAICEVIPKSKLGNIQSVLTDELKVYAERERKRRFLQVICRIATGLALHYTVDQRVGNQELISVAAKGIAQYAVFTFKGTRETLHLRDELSDLIKSETLRIKDQRTERITTKEVVEKERKIERPVAKKTKVEVTEYQTLITQGTIFVEEEKRGLARVWADLTGGSKKRIVQTKGDIHKLVPIKRIEERIEGYEMEYVETVREVVGVTERVVSERPMEGGLPLIEFLIGLGLGVQATSAKSHQSLSTSVKDKQQWVQIALRPVAREIEDLIKSKTENENRILELLYHRLANQE